MEISDAFEASGWWGKAVGQPHGHCRFLAHNASSFVFSDRVEEGEEERKHAILRAWEVVSPRKPF